MKFAIAAVLASAVLLAPVARVFAQATVAGAWDVSMATPQGTTTANLTLTVDGEQVAGQLVSPMGSVPVAGTFSGKALALTASLGIQGMALQFGFNATLANDALDGKVRVGDFGEFPFTARRASASAPPAAAAAPAESVDSPTDVNGKWNIVVSIPGAGAFPVSATLKQEGSQVSGVISSLAGEVAVNGSMTGTAFKLEIKAETPQGPLPITLTGELGAEGLSGKASLAGMGQVDWKGTRGK